MRKLVIFTVVFGILLIFLYYSRLVKEPFIESYCKNFSNCHTCASASGCSWCPKSSVCLSSTALKSTDPDCNQNNTIHSNWRCQTAVDGEFPNNGVHITKYFLDKSIWEDKIADAIPPPNVGLSGKLGYTPEDLTSNMNQINNWIDNMDDNLPNIIAKSVECNIKPMVKGVLSENYYIQGFADFGQAPTTATTLDKPISPRDLQYLSKKCKKYNTCDQCAKDNECSWYRHLLKCDVKNSYPSTQVNSPSACVVGRIGF